MRAPRLGWLAAGVLSIFLAAPSGAQVEVTVEELDIGGNPPGLEGMSGAILQNQNTGTEHLVVFGGCTQDWLWDQALVLSDVSGGFDNLMWETVPVPGMGLACEHVVAGPGDVAYLIGGYKDGWNTLRPMNEVLEIKLTGSAANPVVETTTLNIPCTDCPEPRIGHAAVWLDSFGGCDGGGVLISGGMSNEWELFDDSWIFCAETRLWKSLVNGFLHLPDLPVALSEHGQFRDRYDVMWSIGGRRSLPVENGVFSFDEVANRWVEEQFTGDVLPRLSSAHVFGPYGPHSDKVLLVGGWTEDGDFNKAYWEIDLNNKTIRLIRSSESELWCSNGLMYMFSIGAPKIGGAVRGVLFGGVKDYHAPRVISNSTFLITVSDSGPSAHFAVPAMARVRGAGAFFTSLMHLYAAGNTDLELEMTFTPREGSGGSVTTVNHTVPAGVMQTIEDPLETLFGFTGGAGRVGSVLITVTSGSAADLMAQTVVFAQLDSGEEYGQFFPAMPIGDAISSGQTAYLNTTEDPSHNRVNIGLMAVADGTRYRVRPVDPLGSGLAAPLTFDLDTGGNTQINNLHSTFGLGTMADVVVEVDVLAGSGFAYASVLDGSGSYTGTSDPTTILPSLAGSGKVTLLEIGSIQGLNEFSGSASITNYSNRSAAVRADFFQRGESGVRTTENLTIAAGDTVGYGDLGADLFGVSGDVGSVVLTSTNNTRIGATGREFAIFRDAQNQVVGTAGQLIAGQTDGDRLAAGTTYHFIGLRQERGGGAVERSHFAVYNPAWGDAEITVRLYDGVSGALEGERSWTVERRTLIQVNNVIRAINSGYDGDEKRIEVEVDKPVFMNAFRVNRWGDPVTLSPFPG